jgi:hypothetical protein
VTRNYFNYKVAVYRLLPLLVLLSSTPSAEQKAGGVFILAAHFLRRFYIASSSILKIQVWGAP